MIAGTRLWLGPLLPEDEAALLRWSNDPAATRMSGPYRPVTLAGHRAWFQTVGTDPSKVVFAIRTAADNGLVGYVQATNIHALFQCADLGILIGDEANRGKGYGQEALRLMMAYCWGDLNLTRLGMFVLASNERAIHVYRKLGFTREGILRKAWFVGGQFVDVDVMAILNRRGATAR